MYQTVGPWNAKFRNVRHGLKRSSAYHTSLYTCARSCYTYQRRHANFSSRLLRHINQSLTCHANIFNFCTMYTHPVASVPFFRYSLYSYLFVFVQNHFFGNNSGKSTPIGTKFYRESQPRVTWHVPYKRLVPSAKPARNGETTHRFTHFPADDFCEILTQYANRENFWNRISF